MRPTRKFKRPSHRLRKLAYGLAIALIGLVAAALMLPGYIDWNRFKGEIEAQASAMTGRGVKINGAIGFSLLPRPELFLENVTIANDSGALQPTLLALERLEAHLSVVPLFSGKFQVAEFRMIAPVLNLETSPDGVHNWTWRTAPTAADGPGVRFDNVVIERGTLRYQNRMSAGDLRLSDMEFQLKAESLRGPFEGVGAVKLQDVPVALRTRIGVIQTGRETPVEVKAVLDADTNVNFSGKVSPDGGITGNLNSQGADLTALTNALARISAPLLSDARPGLLRLPYRLESSLSMVPNRLTMEKAKLDLNGNILTGRFSWDASEARNFDIAVSASSLDLNAMPAINTPAGPALGALAASLSNFEIPQDLNGVLRIGAKAVKLNAGHIRDINFAVRLADGSATIEDISAQLPGSTTMKLSGNVQAVEGQPHFAGKLEARTQYLRGLLEWLGITVPDIPERSLSQAGISGLLKLSPQHAELEEIAAAIDSSKITASLALAFREKLALGLVVHVDQWNVDNYRVDANTIGATAPPTGALDAEARQPWDMARSLADRYDSNFKVSVDNLVYRGVPISGLETEGTLIGGTLAINSFAVADLAGSAFSLSGIFSNFTTRPEGEINLRLASNDLTGLARTLDMSLPLAGTQLGKTHLEARLLLANAGLEAVIESHFGDTNVKLNGALSGFAPGIIAPMGSHSAVKAHLSVANPSLKKFAAQAGLAITPAPAQEAAGINLDAEIAGTNEETNLSALSGAIGTTPIQGKAVWRRTEGRAMLQAELSAGDILFENFSNSDEPSTSATPAKNQQVPWSGAPIDFTLFDLFDAEIKLAAARFAGPGYDFVKPSVQIEIRQGKAELKLLSGALFGGEARAEARLHRGETAPEFSASWKLLGADLEAASMALVGNPAITGRLNFSGAVKGAGASSFAIASSLEGDARITASDGFFQGMDLAGFAARLAELQHTAEFSDAVENVLQAGKSFYSRIDAAFAINQGVAQNTELTAISIDSVTAGLNASIDLPRYWVNAEASLTLNAHMSAPPLGIAYIGPLNNPAFTLRTHRLENYFTQGLVSKSLQRVISNRETPVTPVAPPPAPPAPPPAAAAPPVEPDNAAKKILNGILDGIIRGKDR